MVAASIEKERKENFYFFAFLPSLWLTSSSILFLKHSASASITHFFEIPT